MSQSVILIIFIMLAPNLSQSSVIPFVLQSPKNYLRAEKILTAAKGGLESQNPSGLVLAAKHDLEHSIESKVDGNPFGYLHKVARILSTLSNYKNAAQMYQNYIESLEDDKQRRFRENLLQVFKAVNGERAHALPSSSSSLGKRQSPQQQQQQPQPKRPRISSAPTTKNKSSVSSANNDGAVKKADVVSPVQQQQQQPVQPQKVKHVEIADAANDGKDDTNAKVESNAVATTRRNTRLKSILTAAAAVNQSPQFIQLNSDKMKILNTAWSLDTASDGLKNIVKNMLVLTGPYIEIGPKDKMFKIGDTDESGSPAVKSITDSFTNAIRWINDFKKKILLMISQL